MPEETRRSQPVKRAPGLLGKTFNGVMQMIGWIFLSLLFSIIVEMIGIAVFWPEEGSDHAKLTLEQDVSYLNQRITQNVGRVELFIEKSVNDAMAWIDRLSGNWLGKVDDVYDIENKIEHASYSIDQVLSHSTEYIKAIPYVIKTFFVRSALLLFSLPAFLLFFVLGMVDGLVERDLRRWGGGRESSMVYNLARKSIFRFFIVACVIYISLPFSVNPVWIILPFTIAFGLSTRVTFERLKKYF